MQVGKGKYCLTESDAIFLNALSLEIAKRCHVICDIENQNDEKRDLIRYYKYWLISLTKNTYISSVWTDNDKTYSLAYIYSLLPTECLASLMKKVSSAEENRQSFAMLSISSNDYTTINK